MSVLRWVVAQVDLKVHHWAEKLVATSAVSTAAHSAALLDGLKVVRLAVSKAEHSAVHLADQTVDEKAEHLAAMKAARLVERTVAWMVYK